MRTARALALALALAALRAAPAQTATITNFNKTTPAAPVGYSNVQWQNDGGHPTVNISSYVTYPTFQVSCPTSGDLAAPITATIAGVTTTNGAIIDARACIAATALSTALTISKPNLSILLPCATLTQTAQISVTAQIRNTTIHGCAYQGGSASSGTAGGTVINFTGSSIAILVGDSSTLLDTPGFAMSDLSITTPGASGTATALAFYRVQEIDLERIYMIGNNSTGQTAIVLDGNGNYSGGSFISLHISGFGLSYSLIGSSTGGGNASTFLRNHIDCPTSAGSPIAGTIGLNLVYADGNAWVGGDIEGCDTLLQLGAGAYYNSFLAVRNENSNTQVNALAGSQYNIWDSGSTLFTGKVIDAGTRNTLIDAFHRASNNLNGDLWRSQADTTVVNHIDTGIGLGNVRGRQDEWVTDAPGSAGSYQNAWLWGPGDGTTGLQLWQLQDLINNVTRFGVQQYTTAGGQNESFINGAGTGAVCVQCSTNSGTGGFLIDSGGATPTQVAAFDASGDLSLDGNLLWYLSTTLEWEIEAASSADFIIRCPACTVAADILIGYNNGGTELDSQATSAVVINNHSFAGTGGFIVYEGGANYSTPAFTVSSSGNVTAASSIIVTNHLNQAAANDTAGMCTMTTATTCTVSLAHSFASAPACQVTAYGSTPYLASYTWATNVVTVQSATAVSATFSVVCVGNPN